MIEFTENALITNADMVFDELLTRLYETELKYKKELVQVEHDKELMGVKPDLKKKLDLVDLECECNYLKRKFKLELEKMKKRGGRINNEENY